LTPNYECLHELSIDPETNVGTEDFFCSPYCYQFNGDEDDEYNELMEF
jgi:hypothetical protein